MVNIAFMSNQLGERGTEVAMYDYAHYNEKFLGNTSIILHYKNHYFNSDKAIEKFKNRFKVFAIIEKEEVDNILKENNIDIFYYEHGGGINDEQIELEFIPLEDAKSFIYDEKKAKTPGLMFAFYWFFENHPELK